MNRYRRGANRAKLNKRKHETQNESIKRMSLLENKDLSHSDIARPVFDRVWVLCRTGEVTEAINERANPPTTNLVIPLIFEEPATTTNGERVNPGFVHTDNILLTPVGGMTQEMIDRKLAAFQVAALKLPGTRGTAWGSMDQYSGKLVRVLFAASPDKRDASVMRQYVNKYEKAP